MSISQSPSQLLIVVRPSRTKTPTPAWNKTSASPFLVSPLPSRAAASGGSPSPSPLADLPAGGIPSQSQPKATHPRFRIADTGTQSSAPTLEQIIIAVAVLVGVLIVSAGATLLYRSRNRYHNRHNVHYNNNAPAAKRGYAVIPNPAVYYSAPSQYCDDPDSGVYYDPDTNVYLSLGAHMCSFHPCAAAGGTGAIQSTVNGNHCIDNIDKGDLSTGTLPIISSAASVTVKSTNSPYSSLAHQHGVATALAGTAPLRYSAEYDMCPRSRHGGAAYNGFGITSMVYQQARAVYTKEYLR
ncbi:hypothetical protein SeLEV6574_g00385 [Synchytrium endobioticum]|uniref:OCRE domain-containing protein n=1 Tax=Synchytrium endobioticum TaxID=286115 RepID=A0A507DK53_9FUNG|nr:hypothetical protein SeLEV6574_g00385 [Synchytrium endobioticum]